MSIVKKKEALIHKFSIVKGKKSLMSIQIPSAMADIVTLEFTGCVKI
jgi:hypothetical protein